MNKFPYQGREGASAACDVPAMGNRLRFLREQKGWTHNEAAEALGMSRGGYIKLERGETQLTTATIHRAAKAYGVHEGEIVSAITSTIPVVGMVGAGGAIETAWEQQSEPLHEIEIPFPFGESVIGLEVRGDSMWPRYDSGDVIVVAKAGEPIESLLGFEAAVRTSDGHRYFKRIVDGAKKGLFDLESYNAPTMRGVEIEWAAGRIATIPASRWKTVVRKVMKQPAKPSQAKRKPPP